MRNALAIAASACVATTLAATGTPTLALDALASDHITRLAGRWSGDASLVPASGPSRAFKCVVVYRAAGDGRQLNQKLRCKSPDYNLEAATVLHIAGTSVTGSWEDPVNAIGGDVKGIVTAGGFDVELGGRFFQAKLEVSGSGCEQQVKLTPARADYMKELSANLRKC